MNLNLTMSHPRNLPVSPSMPPSQEQSIFLDFNGDTPDTVHGSQTRYSVPARGRVLILCFDGTGNTFGTNSNVVRFFRALEKKDRKKQVVYYQSGIGTSEEQSFIINPLKMLASAVDAAIALHLDDHIKEGYRFIVQNYRPGDKICLFGFSRGAHTARAVAGMVYKVGILPQETSQQVDLAFNIYKTMGYSGYKLSKEFKRTFTQASNITVDFVGVWDTVSSVGIIPQMHTYTSINYAVKKFRHALSLDERRAKFHPDLWSEITLAREHDLDMDILVPDIPDGLNRDDFVYAPPDRDIADVKEVWFAGTHSDVGGGSHLDTRPTSLSFIPLRWMIKECILNETGIIFDLEYLQDHLRFDFAGLLDEIDNDPEKQSCIIPYSSLTAYRDAQLNEERRANVTKDPIGGTNLTEDEQRRQLEIRRFGLNAQDILDESFDQLNPFWWMLEMSPVVCKYQDLNGNWIRRRMRNFGRGRYIPVYEDKVLVHSSVMKRIQATGGQTYRPEMFGLLPTLLDRFRNRNIMYIPRAYNWSYLLQENLIEYVD